MRHLRTVALARPRHRGPSRIQIGLAALWMILSLALGGALTAEPASDGKAEAPITGTVEP